MQSKALNWERQNDMSLRTTTGNLYMMSKGVDKGGGALGAGLSPPKFLGKKRKKYPILTNRHNMEVSYSNTVCSRPTPVGREYGGLYIGYEEVNT